MTIKVHKKSLGAFYWQTSGSNKVLPNLVSQSSRFFSINPTTVNTLFGGGSPADSFTSLLLHFDGAYTDSSTFNNTVTPVGTSTFVSGKFGQAMSVAGNGYVQIDGTQSQFAFGTGDFTFDFWVKIAALPSAGNIYIPLNNGVNGVGVDWSTAILPDGSLFFATIADGLVLQSSANALPADNTFHHVALVRHNNSFTYYVDGVSKGNNPSYTNPVANSSSALTVGGGNAYPGNNQFIGQIDEVRISKGIARWITGFVPPTSAYGNASKAATFTNLQLDANLAFVTSSDITVTAADYADTNWASNGWTTGTDATFETELETFIINNFGQKSVNLNGQDFVIVITRGSIGGVNYTIPFSYVGDQGDISYIQGDSFDVLNLHFDGDTLDTSPAANNIIKTNASIVFDAGGKFGKAYTPTDYLVYVDPNSTNFSTNFNFSSSNFTMEAWIKNNGSASGVVFSGGQTFNANGWFFAAPGFTGLQVFFLNGSNYTLNSSSQPQLADGNWHHVALVRSGTTLIQFVDGIIVAQDNSSPNFPFQSNLPFCVGSIYTPNNNPLGSGDKGSAATFQNGSIDEVRISKTARWTSNFVVPAGPYTY